MQVKDLFRKVQYPIKLYDSRGRKIYCEGSDGFWRKYKHDEKGKLVYYETRQGWWKSEHDDSGKEIYFENSAGVVRDNRQVKEMTVEQICKELGYDVKVVKNKD